MQSLMLFFVERADLPGGGIVGLMPPPGKISFHKVDMDPAGLGTSFALLDRRLYFWSDPKDQAVPVAHETCHDDQSMARNFRRCE
jgi:hypothetical protein